jgi:hypothetical protein
MSYFTKPSVRARLGALREKAINAALVAGVVMAFAVVGCLDAEEADRVDRLQANVAEQRQAEANQDGKWQVTLPLVESGRLAPQACRVAEVRK